MASCSPAAQAGEQGLASGLASAPLRTVLSLIKDAAAFAFFASGREAPEAGDLGALSAALRSVLHVFNDGHQPGRALYLGGGTEGDTQRVILCSGPKDRTSPPTTALAIRPQESRRMSAQLVKVPFRGKDLLAIEEGSEHYIPLRPYCDRLGVSVEGQLAKLKKADWATVKIIFMVAEDGKPREMACIPLRAMAGWLLTIHPSKVKPEVREDLALYQREATDVLYKHFFGAAVPTPALPSAELVALRAELAELKAAVLAPRFVSSLPVVGEQDARVYILGPMRQIARKRARLEGKRWRSISKTLDNELRELAGYPMVRDASWEMMPRDKLPIVHRKLSRWQRDADEALAQRLDAEAPSQLPLAG